MALRILRKPPTDEDFRENRQFDQEVYDYFKLIGSATVNPGLIAAQTVYTTTITVTGARAGMTVLLGPPSGIIASVTWCAYVSANDTVTLRIANPTAAGITPASATWNVRVML